MMTIMLTMRKGKDVAKKKIWLCDEIMVNFSFSLFSIMITVFLSIKLTLQGFTSFTYNANLIFIIA